MLRTNFLKQTKQKQNALTLLWVIILSTVTSISKMGGYYAFTNVAVSALSGSLGVFSMLASLVVYIVTGTYSQNIVQICSIILIVSLKLLFQKDLKTSANCILTTSSILLCSLISSLVQRTPPMLMTFRLVSAIFCGCLVYIFTSVYKYFKQSGNISIKGINGVYVSFIYIVLITTLCSVSAFSLNLGRTVGIFSVLIFAKKFGIKGGGVLSVIFIFSVVIFSPSLAQNILFLTTSAVLCGSLYAFRNIAITVSMLISSVIGLATIGFNLDTFRILTDITLACVFFVSIPQEVLNKMFNIIIYDDAKILNIKNSSLSFVNMPNKALLEIRNRLDEISKNLPETNKINVNRFENTSLMRYLLTQQLSITCDLLTDIERNISYNSQINLTLSKRCEELLFKYGIIAKKVNVYQYNNSRTVEVFLNKEPNTDMIKLTVEMGEIVECDLEMPNIIKIGDIYKLTFSKYTEYKITNHLVQINCENEEFCGDTVERVWLTSDKFLVILSDGMGTGKGAKLDSTFTTSLILRLISAGTSPQTAIKLSNSIMCVKGWNESFATVDVAIFDLCKGEVTFVKSGASPSYILRDENVIKIECDSFPIGILSETTFTSKSYKLFENDYVIISSDGVEENSVINASKEVTKNSLNVKQTAEIISEISKLNKNISTRDDISVFVSKVSAR